MLAGMTRIPILFAAIVASATPAVAAERHYSVTDFDRVIIEGPFIVRLSTGRATSAAASGSTAALDRLSVVSNAQTLRIRRNSAYWGGNTEAQQGPVTIDLVTRNLRSVRLIGPGTLDIDRVSGLRVELLVEGSGRLRAANVSADNLGLGLAGSGRIELAGAAGSLTADIQGTGDVDASALRVENASITSTTTGRIALGVTRAATVNALGLGIIDIIGRADCTRRGPNADLVRCDIAPLDQR
jgi:hypothetical protein